MKHHVSNSRKQRHLHNLYSEILCHSAHNEMQISYISCGLFYRLPIWLKLKQWMIFQSEIKRIFLIFMAKPPCVWQSGMSGRLLTGSDILVLLARNIRKWSRPHAFHVFRKITVQALAIAAICGLTKTIGIIIKE